MGREIKFRVWSKENKKMIYQDDRNYFVRTYMGNNGSRQTIGLSLAVRDNGHRLEMMQYSGLKDANGVEIYEGDILKDSDGISGEVVMEEGNTYWNWLNISTLLSEVHETLDRVGNIYENQELIEVSE